MKAKTGIINLENKFESVYLPMPKMNPFDEKLRKDIAYNIVEIMKFKHVNNSQLAKLSGIPRSSLVGYLTNVATPNVDRTKLIADALNVSQAQIDPRVRELDLDKIPSHHDEDLLIDYFEKMSSERRKIILQLASDQAELSIFDQLKDKH